MNVQDLDGIYHSQVALSKMETPEIGRIELMKNNTTALWPVRLIDWDHLETRVILQIIFFCFEFV